MGLTTRFVEYLIIGTHSTASLVLFIWLLGDFHSPQLQGIGSPVLVFILPFVFAFVYLIGMAVDQVVFLLLRDLCIRKIKFSARVPEKASDEYICYHSKELFQAYSYRVQRIRVLGSAIFNWLIIGILSWLHLRDQNCLVAIAVLGICFILTIFSIIAWITLYSRAYQFLRKAYWVIETNKNSHNTKEAR